MGCLGCVVSIVFRLYSVVIVGLLKFRCGFSVYRVWVWVSRGWFDLVI